MKKVVAFAAIALVHTAYVHHAIYKNVDVFYILLSLYMASVAFFIKETYKSENKLIRFILLAHFGFCVDYVIREVFFNPLELGVSQMVSIPIIMIISIYDTRTRKNKNKKESEIYNIRFLN